MITVLGEVCVRGMDSRWAEVGDLREGDGALSAGSQETNEPHQSRGEEGEGGIGKTLPELGATHETPLTTGAA